MMAFPKKLYDKIEYRRINNALRKLDVSKQHVDFSSNDYLGYARSEQLFDRTHSYLTGHDIKQNGATGSRLLTGNHALYHQLETVLSEFHLAEAALVFNSGYNANIGQLFQ